MSSGNARGGLGDTIPVGTAVQVLAHGAPRGVLHRHAFQRGALPQGRLLLVRQPQRHRHAADGISVIPHRRETQTGCGDVQGQRVVPTNGRIVPYLLG
jgi:hypothetical protein